MITDDPGRLVKHNYVASYALGIVITRFDLDLEKVVSSAADLPTVFPPNIRT